jgi:hypothetical protein
MSGCSLGGAVASEDAVVEVDMLGEQGISPASRAGVLCSPDPMNLNRSEGFSELNPSELVSVGDLSKCTAVGTRGTF